MAVWLVAAAVNGLIGVTMGAIAAHGMPGDPDAQRQAWMDTAVAYQMWHALALLAVGLLAADAEAPRRAALILAGTGFLVGIVLFSGSLYLLALTDFRGLVWITPIGGSAFLLGWVALGWHGLGR